MGFEGLLEWGVWLWTPDVLYGSLFQITGPAYEKDLWPKVFGDGRIHGIAGRRKFSLSVSMYLCVHPLSPLCSEMLKSTVYFLLVLFALLLLLFLWMKLIWVTVKFPHPEQNCPDSQWHGKFFSSCSYSSGNMGRSVVNVCTTGLRG